MKKPDMPFTTLPDILQAHTQTQPDAIAIDARDRDPLTYAALWQQIITTIHALNQHGIHRADRVALVLPDGPNLAAALIATMCGMTAVPLNPACQHDELIYFFKRWALKRC